MMKKSLNGKRLSPEVEFADDPMMCELHKIGMKMYEETKKMTADEWVEYIHKQAKKLKESMVSSEK